LLRGLKSKLEDELLAIGYMDKAQADHHMVANKLHYKDVNAVATKAHRMQFDRREWPPSKNLPDYKPPPPGCGANVAEGKVWCGTQAEVLAMIHEVGKGTAPTAVWTGTQAEVLALIKEAGGGPKTGACHNCGKSDHWARECTEPRKERAHSGVPNWKRAPPPDGTPNTKTANGKIFRWCAKCSRWTTTHDTASHTGKPGKGKTEANLGLVESANAWDVSDPSAWHVGINDSLSMHDAWDLFGPCIKLLQFGLLLYFAPVFFDFVVHLLRTIGTTMWAQGFGVVAPLVWLISLLVTLWLGLLPFQDENPEPRWKRRNRTKDAKRQQKAGRGWDPGSIRSHGFHCKYPIDLRGLGHFVRNPPPVEHQNAWKYLSRIIGELQHCLRLLGLADPTQPPPVHVAGTGRKGGGGKRGGKPYYRPAPASGHHNMGNRNFTCRQAGAAKNLHKHHANMASVDDWSAHQDWSTSPDPASAWFCKHLRSFAML
jgi:hypothetical protein